MPGIDVPIPPFPEPFHHTPEEAMDFVGRILWDIVDRAKSELKPTPKRVVHLNVGQRVPWDEVCEGQLAGRILTITPWTGPRGAAALPCGVWEWIVTLGVSIVRCISTVDDDGTVPTTNQMDLDGLQMTRDLANLQRVIQCHPSVRTVGAWNPLGAQGGGGGGEWTFQVRVSVCACPDHLTGP